MQENNDEIKSSNAIHIFIYVILIAALGVSIFFNLTAETGEVASKDQKGCSGIEDLPTDVQKMYVQRSELTSLHNSYNDIKQKNDALEKQLVWLKTNTPKEPEEEMTPTQKMTKGTVMAKDFAKCYDMKEGEYYISYQCKKDIVSFVDKHKDAKYFEIIPIVDDSEFKLFKNLENNNFIYENLGTNQSTIDKLKMFAQEGLAKQRAVEASWVIKAHTNREATTFTVHYELVSKEGRKGILVRAYEAEE
jgi:hypothetical protein